MKDGCGLSSYKFFVFFINFNDSISWQNKPLFELIVYYNDFDLKNQENIVQYQKKEVLMNMDLLNWFLENSKMIDNVLMVVGVVIEVGITAGIYMIWKVNKNKRQKDRDVEEKIMENKKRTD